MLGAEAADPSYVGPGALGVLALVIAFFVRSNERSYKDQRDDRAQMRADLTKALADLAAADARCEAKDQEILLQRKLKHDADTDLSKSYGALEMVAAADPNEPLSEPLRFLAAQVCESIRESIEDRQRIAKSTHLPVSRRLP